MNRKRKLKRTTNDELNKIMDEFWKVMRMKNIPISGTILQTTALRYATDLGLTDFKGSDGCLRSFKSRHNIKFKTICGEGKDVNIETVENWKLKLPLMCHGFDKKDIYNADETGIFFKALPISFTVIIRYFAI